jgi:hypothetical protein
MSQNRKAFTPASMLMAVYNHPDEAQANRLWRGASVVKK